MSSRWYPEVGYGMFLDTDEAISMAKKVFEVKTGFPCNEEDDDISEFYLEEDGYATIVDREDRYDQTGVEYLQSKEKEENVNGAIFYCDRHGTIFTNETKDNCYKDIHEMADYFRDKYDKYLPEDFDYEKHLVLFWGANWG